MGISKEKQPTVTVREAPREILLSVIRKFGGHESVAEALINVAKEIRVMGEGLGVVLVDIPNSEEPNVSTLIKFFPEERLITASTAIKTRLGKVELARSSITGVEEATLTGYDKDGVGFFGRKGSLRIEARGIVEIRAHE